MKNVVGRRDRSASIVAEHSAFAERVPDLRVLGDLVPILLRHLDLRDLIKNKNGRP